MGKEDFRRSLRTTARCFVFLVAAAEHHLAVWITNAIRVCSQSAIARCAALGIPGKWHEFGMLIGFVPDRACGMAALEPKSDCGFGCKICSGTGAVVPARFTVIWVDASTHMYTAKQAQITHNIHTPRFPGIDDRREGIGKLCLPPCLVAAH